MNTRLALMGRHPLVRPALIVAALAVALAAYLLLAAPAAGRHRETLAEATAARNPAHGAAWDTRQAAAGAAGAERDQILRDGQAASDKYAEEWRVKVAQARAPHEKAAAAATEQNFTDRVLAQQARSETVGTELAVEKAPEVVESEARGKRNRIVNECARSGGLFGASTECVKKGDAAAEKHRGTKDARIKAAAAEHAKAIKAVEAADAAQLKSYRAWEAATAAADEAEGKVTGAGDPIVPAQKRAEKTYTDGVAAADAALADAKASADAELADVRGRADLLRSVSNGAGMAVAGAFVLAAAVLAWPFLTRGARSARDNPAVQENATAFGRLAKRFWSMCARDFRNFFVWWSYRQTKGRDYVDGLERDQARDSRQGRMTAGERDRAIESARRRAAESTGAKASGTAWSLFKRGGLGVAFAFVVVQLLSLIGRLSTPAPETMWDTAVTGFGYVVPLIMPLQIAVGLLIFVLVLIVLVGHVVTVPEPSPDLIDTDVTVQAVDGDPHADTLARSLKDSDRRAWGHLLTPAVVVPIDGGRQYTWKLPAGLPASQVDRARLMSHASALGEHPRLVECSGQRVVVDVLDVAPEDLPAPSWAAPERSNFRDPMPVGKARDGRDVTVNLTGARVAVIGKSGHGKTFLARQLALWAAQDPRVDLRVADLKGDAKLSMLRGCADTWATSGDMDAAHGLVAAVAEEVERRNLWSGTDPSGREPVDVFGPLVLFVDEVDMMHRTVSAGRLETIARRCRSAGVTLIVATQETRQKSVPTGVLSNCTTRLVGEFERAHFVRQMMGVPDDTETADLPTGTWALKDPNRSGWVTVRAALVDDDEARQRATAAAEVRAQHMPVVEVQDTTRADEDTEPDPLADLLATMAGRQNMTWAEVAEELGKDVAAACREVVPSQTLRRPDGYPRGVRREAVEAAVRGRHMTAT